MNESSPETSPVKNGDSDSIPTVMEDPLYLALYEKSYMVLIPTLSDGHCILYSMQNCLQYLENKVVPTIQEMFSLLKYEILQHVDFYSGFLNNVDTDFLDE